MASRAVVKFLSDSACADDCEGSGADGLDSDHLYLGWNLEDILTEEAVADPGEHKVTLFSEYFRDVGDHNKGWWHS
jgi:hypothetical protein